ncbi:hypothetical protein M1145_00875 [Patescibacteria group bacterium]|nr:hypothetical protein [Patescibacteria group bacterium]
MDQLKIKFNGLNLYSAGIPNFKSNFTRDSIISAILMHDKDMLKNQLEFSALKQGKTKDPFTGEEKGKIFHEYPGVVMNGKSTMFNASDTTALFLLGHCFYYIWTSDSLLLRSQKLNIDLAIEYILSHINKDYLFEEDPHYSNSDRFALNVTYWKDSSIIERDGGSPIYPVVYTLVHAQNLYALKKIGEILNRNDLIDISRKMLISLDKLYDNTHNIFYIAIDKEGPISAISSDMLFMLFFFDKGDLKEKFINSISRNAKYLKTNIGYKVLNSDFLKKSKIDPYHARTVWPYEQAIINIGARKFGLSDIEKTTLKMRDRLNSSTLYPEVYLLEKNGKTKKIGCDIQLWSMASKYYFNNL